MGIVVRRDLYHTSGGKGIDLLLYSGLDASRQTEFPIHFKSISVQGDTNDTNKRLFNDAKRQAKIHFL